MAWTDIARQRYCRAGLRYASDLTDAEWALIEPFMPMPPHRGRPRTVALRRIVEAIFYMLSAGCHMWTAPSLQDFCGDVYRIACVHMSGLLVRSHMNAGQDGFREASSKQWSGLSPWISSRNE